VKILIASDSFKDCLSGIKVGEYLTEGLKLVSPDFEVRNIPMGDGGEGTVLAMVAATGGKIVKCRVKGPLFNYVDSYYGVLGDNKTAVIEMATASGIELLSANERNPWLTTTYGTGQLVIDAIERGYNRIICCIGGSATNDGGIGMASAIGYRFLNKKGDEVNPVGGELQLIETIDMSEVDKRIAQTEFIIACDVNNPLTGKDGAAYVYAPQKGADAQMVAELDNGLHHLAEKIKQYLNKDVEKLPGAGAAGGLGAGFVAFANGKLKSGIEIVIEESGLASHCKWGDIVITGEGKIDFQTKYGKTPKGVADTAKKFGKPVIAIAGTLGDNYTELYNAGFDLIYSIIDKPMNLEEALNEAPQLIKNAGFTIGKMLLFT